jgi:hypothetical protein
MEDFGVEDCMRETRATRDCSILGHPPARRALSKALTLSADFVFDTRS